jgi:hypothetical protein
MLDFLRNLDRRWIFLAMLLAVAIPIYAQKTFPEKPTKPVYDVFNYIEGLEPGSKILFSLDYAPSTEGELAPMTTALTRHCGVKGHEMYFMTLYPEGLPLVEKDIRDVIEKEFPDLKYGEDYVNLGYSPGYEVAIIAMGTDIKKIFPRDNRETPLDSIAMTEDLTSLEDFDLIVTISTGYPGVKEWVQYAAGPYDVKVAAGATAVQAPQAYPYIPSQLLGLLAAIKGAAEYEAALAGKYKRFREPEYQTAIRRMAPQFWAHLLIIGLIALANGIYFAERLRERER